MCQCSKALPIPGTECPRQYHDCIKLSCILEPPKVLDQPLPLGSFPWPKPHHIPLMGKITPSQSGEACPACQDLPGAQPFTPGARRDWDGSAQWPCPRTEHPRHIRSWHPYSNRKDQKALGGCYGNSHKLDQYSVQGAVCVTDVGAGGCDSWGGAGPCRGAPLPGLCPRPGPGCATASAPRDPGMGLQQHQLPPTHLPSLGTPRGGEGLGRAGGGSQKFHQENTFLPLPRAPAEPSTRCEVGEQQPLHQQPHCEWWGCDLTAWPLLCPLPRGAVPGAVTPSHLSPCAGQAQSPQPPPAPGGDSCLQSPGHTVPGARTDPDLAPQGPGGCRG